MQITVRIERYADQGRCVAHSDGRVVFVRFALPGELVRIELDEPHERKDRFWTGEVVEVLEASELRVPPAWPLAGPLADGGGVGGADLVHVSLPGQLAWKSATVTEQMRRLGHVEIPDVPVERIAGDEEMQGLHWRTRIELIADEQGRPSMRRRGSHQRVPIDTMPLASQALLAVAQEHGIWDGGLEPDAHVRIAVPEPRDIDTAADGTALHNTAADSTAVNNTAIQSTAADNADVANDSALRSAVGENYAILVDGKLAAGSDQLRETTTVGARTFHYRVSSAGFWQMHRRAPLVLPQHVMTLVDRVLQGRRSPVIWDLYSGSGLFTLPLAVHVPDTRMLSVEGAAQPVENARRNLGDMGIHAEQVKALAGDVSAVLRHVSKSLAHPDVVVLDPPRAGARKEACRQIAAAHPAGIVYIACDPASLARDTAALTSQGYRLADIHAFDIYPMTHHVETVALFTRKDFAR
ncbi:MULTISPECIES: class I SAM-dependent RNA methyltransferase [Bifidobacterium]|jgi:tRNA/tmRNA/rRNA uracil-C5-methylase (TrmA/RlmC/RlmD family)|uniref:Class I SAM-dependent RNA methyltransferase n=1 Tax=Bifidobacterium tibiigranuli TaxID=2172043 RepID=A0A5N6S3A7_9BIFI|nr:TRAM domain-containing protein [Bifidobacterium tibiigranuli]KAE8128417.1 class I SAM-dependent RNA methyltransferase [Bifidobacterium tibiigranuli]KAE8128567.1 RNA methyltransferase [Bifidobacterium tibiigranuli]MCI1254060.1 TRAM domain-containing protein [Bifidobacterium tibiigranuli]